MRIDLYGKKIEVIHSKIKWQVYYLGSEGKKRLANDIIIPREIEESELIHYLEALYHEMATPGNPQISIISPPYTKQ